MSMREGRNSPTVQGYIDICNAVINLAKEGKKQEQGKTCLFGFAATTLMWNCCCRSETLDCLHLQHMDWYNDCMKLTVLKTKKDHAGTESDIFTPRIGHIFPAPLQPSTYPILAMALYTFTQRQRYQETTNRFPGIEQKQRFCQLQQRIIIGKGMNKADWEGIGSHSFRKGSITYLLGMPGGPCAISVYLRAAWSLGTTQDRCITGGEGNDNFCGRILAGNNLKKESFDLFTPHFTKAALTKLQQTGFHCFIDGYESFPDSFKRCIPWGAPIFAALGPDTIQQLEELSKEMQSLKESIAGFQQTYEQNNTANGANPVPRQDIDALKLELCKFLDEKLAGGVTRSGDVNDRGEEPASSVTVEGYR
eukprot:767803-Hanusia_phi.AAC.5